MYGPIQLKIHEPVCIHIHFKNVCRVKKPAAVHLASLLCYIIYFINFFMTFPSFLLLQVFP